jgi:hypothetical protein
MARPGGRDRPRRRAGHRRPDPPRPGRRREPEKTSLETELQAIAEAAPLPASDLTLIDELPHAPGLLAQAPDDLRERLAAAFAMQAIYRPDTRQATIILTITDTTPATINAILADPRIDHDTATTRPPQTASPATSENASVDASDTPIEYWILRQNRISSGRGWLSRTGERIR